MTQFEVKKKSSIGGLSPARHCCPSSTWSYPQCSSRARKSLSPIDRTDGGGPIKFSTRCKSVRQGQQGHLGGASWILQCLNLRLSTWRTLLLLRPPDTLFLHRHHSWSGRLFGVSMARARRGRRTGAPLLGDSCRRLSPQQPRGLKRGATPGVPHCQSPNAAPHCTWWITPSPLSRNLRR